MTVEETFQKIKDLEIQGAEKIALAAVAAFAEKLKITKEEKTLKEAINLLSSARPTEPALRNALHYCLLNFTQDPNVAETVTSYFQTSKEKITEYGANKIQNGMTVFTHCHSGTVTAILKKAWSQGKKFTVRNTETRPKFQGRITAQELAEAGIPVTMSVESAARTQMQKADLFLFGADAVTVEGNVINKIGTTMLAEFAHLSGIPVYACTNSWKFDPHTMHGESVAIEQRDPAEVWPDVPAGITVINPAFELTSADRITGIITELGIFKPETLVLEIQKTYPWLIEK